MKKIILFASILLTLSSCALLDLLNKKKRNEEFEYFAFNEKTKAAINKSDVYVTKLTKIDSLNTALYEVRTRFANDAKHIGSWDFSAKPSEILNDEINAKAIELGANYIILFEKRDCDYIDLVRGTITGLEGNNCYIILYYHLPAEKLENRHKLIKTPDIKTNPEPAEKSEEAHQTTPPTTKIITKHKNH